MKRNHFVSKGITGANEKQMQRFDTLKRTHRNTLPKVGGNPLDQKYGTDTCI